MFKDVLIALRKEMDLNQKELAERLGLARSTISGYEQGTRFPRQKDLENISDYFNVDIDYLLGKSSVKRKIDLSELREEYILDALLADISKNNTDIDLKIIKKYVKMTHRQKEKLNELIDIIIKE